MGLFIYGLVRTSLTKGDRRLGLLPKMFLACAAWRSTRCQCR